MTIVNDDSWVVNKLETPLTDDMFIVAATDTPVCRGTGSLPSFVYFLVSWHTGAVR
jgi:hypothetical protein